MNPLPSQCLIAATGAGKTFISGAVLRRLIDNDFHKDKTYGVTNYLYVTKSSVVEKTKRDLRNHFGIHHPNDVEVVNIEQLRSRAGQLWIQRKTKIEYGEEVEYWEWKPLLSPCVIVWDECQVLKNDSSTQHKIATAYSKLPNVTQLFVSATPFARVSEAKALCLSLRLDISPYGFPEGTILTENNWLSFANFVAQGDPTDYNESAVERLMKIIDPFVIRVKGVRWQFNAINNVEIIDFQSPDEAKEYTEAWNKYLAKKAKLEESITDNPLFQLWIETAIFLAAAENCKRFIYAERMVRDVNNGYAAVLAVKQKKTLINVVKILNEKYGVPRDKISLVWGGGQTQLTAKQKLKMKVLENKELFEKSGITMEDMMLNEVEERIVEDLPEHLRLGSQAKDERQREIDRFQRGQSLFCIYTLKAGGAGLSLHHTDEMVKEKVRRKESGYAVEEDIPKIPTRPRKATITPTWSAIELVQAIGRCPRLTSLSNTIQTMLFYRDTVEEQQSQVVMHKLKCLGKVVRQRESWTDLVVKHYEAQKLADELIKQTEQQETNDPQETELVAVDEEDEEE